MPRLVFLRHAKAVPGKAAEDHDRALAPRGEDEAAWAGRAIAEAHWAPALALVSDARRTQQTFAIAALSLRPAPRLQLAPTLYDATPEDIMAAIAAVDPAAACLLVVGHNPGLALTVSGLAQAGEPALRRRLEAGFPPATIAVVTLAGNHWRDVAGGGTLEAVLTPP